MNGPIEISVVITTRNRASLLQGAIESVLKQKSEDVKYEILVVDNNSQDETPEIIRLFEQRTANLHGIEEKRPGISYGRNAGIGAARGEIIAFTDDDITVSDDWIAKIKQIFDEHPEVEYLGGKVLPHWSRQPPKWLTRAHWAPVTLVDWGEQPFYVSAKNPVCLPTANAAFRRTVFERVGNFSPDFSGREDHELLVRLWQDGQLGLYEPTLIAYAEIPPERLTRKYHRRWNVLTGKFNSRMKLNELMGADGQLRKKASSGANIFGVPAFIYRQLLTESAQWVASLALSKKGELLQHENRIYYYVGYVGERYRQHFREFRSKHESKP